MSKSPDAFRTISEVAEDLDLPQHVLRFWETRFGQIRPMKRGGGRRYYRPDDVDLLRGIRYLLYGEGYTIRGVQRILKEQGARFVVGAGRGEIVGLPGKARTQNGINGKHEEPTLNGHVGNGHAEDGHDGYLEPRVNGALDEDTDDAPEMALDRDDHDPEDDAAEDRGMVGAARRFVGQFMEGRAPSRSEGGLSREDIGRLQGVLAELLECKRLLDAAR